MNVREVMTTNPRCVSPNDSIQMAARIMKEEDTGVVPIVDNGRAVGVVTDRDIVIRAIADGGQPNKPVREICSRDLVCATPDMSTREATRIMSERQIRRLPVVEGDRLVGIVSIGDIAVKEGRDSRTGDTLENISEGVKRTH
jgi:CBS domain-containing protein